MAAESVDFDIAFEHDVGDRPAELWRVRSWRGLAGERLLITTWFATEDAAAKCTARAAKEYGEEAIVSHYVLEAPGGDG